MVDFQTCSWPNWSFCRPCLVICIQSVLFSILTQLRWVWIIFLCFGHLCPQADCKTLICYTFGN
uniref:Uncharacterized protein n=1 Tax=Anguilla anguilla TaxID=7936 RepID=A0A0E9W6V8_ANGAN